MSCNHLHKIGGICCQKIIPLVFDQSYSYYEQLCAFLHKLNELVDAVNLQNTTIAEFENEVNDAFNLFKNEIRLAFADFQIEMRQEFEDFTTQIETEWNAYKTDLTAQWENEKQVNAAFRSDLQSAWNTYRTELNTSFEIFKSQETAARQTFETNITNQQNTFETGITQQQTTFENNLTTRQNNFETEIREQVEDVTHVRQLSYVGTYSGVISDSATIPSIASSPIDIGDMIVRVYHKSYLGDSFKFIKRLYYSEIENDTDIPAWYAHGDAYAVVFENPIVNEWIKSGITIYNHASTFFFKQTPRLVIRKFNTINNEQLALGDSILQASYRWPGTAQQVGEVLQLQQVEAPMTATPPYYYTAFIFYDAMGLHIDLINQPTDSTTKLFPGFIYDGYRGGVIRDPTVANFRENVNAVAFGGGNELLPNTDLHNLTPGRYFIGQSNAGTIANRPENLTFGFNVECSSIFDRSTNRLKLRLYYNSASTIGTFYECYLTSSGWSAWYKFSGTVVT